MKTIEQLKAEGIEALKAVAFDLLTEKERIEEQLRVLIPVIREEEAKTPKSKP